MCNTYFIRGTMTIRVDCINSSELRIGITPCAGFLTPDKPQKAIAFPVSKTETETETKNDSDQIGTAKLINLNEKSCEFDAKVINAHIPALLSIAGQQKTIELRLNEDGNSSLKIVGFVYPVQ